MADCKADSHTRKCARFRKRLHDEQIFILIHKRQGTHTPEIHIGLVYNHNGIGIFATISSIVSRFSIRPVGALGFGKIMPPFSLR